MPMRTWVVWLSIFSVAWLLLGVVNLVRGQQGLGILYLSLGVLIGLADVAAIRARRRP